VAGYAHGVVVAIAGAHGKIARRLTRRLVENGHQVIGLIRNPDHADDIGRDGAAAVVCDLEAATADEVANAIKGADAAVFAAGAGPGSGAERKLTMDRDGAVKLVQAAATAGVPRFVIVSSVGAENPPEGDDGFSVYVRAKAEADEAVRASDREWTIVRPGRLSDEPGSGRVKIDSEPFRGEVARDDVADVIARLLSDSRFSGKVLYVNGGEAPVEQALGAIL
jgi:nucleoside-diphosphate-sugar epimerase